MCYENYSQIMPNITSHSNSLPARCVESQEYSKYANHHMLANHDNLSPNMSGLDSNQNYPEHLQPYFAYNYPHTAESSQPSFIPYEKVEYLNHQQPIEYGGHESYVLQSDLHRYQQSSPSSEHMMPPTTSIPPLAATSSPPLLTAASGQIKQDEEFSGILADVRKTCFSS